MSTIYAKTVYLPLIKENSEKKESGYKVWMFNEGELKEISGSSDLEKLAEDFSYGLKNNLKPGPISRNPRINKETIKKYGKNLDAENSIIKPLSDKDYIDFLQYVNKKVNS